MTDIEQNESNSLQQIDNPVYICMTALIEDILEKYNGVDYYFIPSTKLKKGIEFKVGNEMKKYDNLIGFPAKPNAIKVIKRLVYEKRNFQIFYTKWLEGYYMNVGWHEMKQWLLKNIGENAFVNKKIIIMEPENWSNINRVIIEGSNTYLAASGYYSWKTTLYKVGSLECPDWFDLEKKLFNGVIKEVPEPEIIPAWILKKQSKGSKNSE